METLKTDLVIVGGGAAGFSAAVKALECSQGSLGIVLIDKNPVLGGTSTYGGVNCWEPGIGGAGIHNSLSASLLETGKAGVARYISMSSCEQPWSFSRIIDGEPYENTLRRAGVIRDNIRRFHFEPDAMSKAMKDRLSGFDNLNLMLNTSLISVKTSRNNIDYIHVADLENSIEYKIIASCFIDCSGDIALARMSGCSYTYGEESADTCDEESAPESSSSTVNGLTLIFRVSPSSQKHIDIIPKELRNIDVSFWFDKNVTANKLSSQINEYPDGDLNINMLPTMQGEEYMSMPEQEAFMLCKARLFHYWQWLQKEKGMSSYRFKHFFPMLGIRETYRLVGEYVLTENDIRAGFLNQMNKEDIIAYADHSMDTHGKTNFKGQRNEPLNKPYGIPYQCLLTKETENVLVACRGASFSHIAASSCRLTRTVMQLGEAAGAAAVEAIKSRRTLKEVKTDVIREKLGLIDFEKML